MSQPCLRCGFPNEEKALHCRACSAPLQDQGADTAIKPRLRQILAETRARTRARQRRGVSVDPNRVDVVPRLPSGVAASETALKTALEKGRQARLEGLREELRKGRPAAQPPMRHSLPPQEPGATLPPSEEELAARDEAKRAAAEKVAAEQAAAEAARAKAASEEAAAQAAAAKAAAEQEAARAAAQKAAEEKAAAQAAALKAAEEKAAAEAAAQKAKAEKAAAQAATEKAEIERQAARQAAEVAAATYLDEPAAPNPVRVLSAPGTVAPEQAAAVRDEVAEPSIPPAEATPSVEPQLVPALRAAGQQALARLRAAAERLRVEAVDAPDPEEQRCALFGRRRCLVTLIDAVPALIASFVWLGTAFSGANKPPEEVLASWVLGEAGGLPLGLLAPCFAWLIWAWIGIALWRVSPGMKVMGLCWSDGPIWRVYARPLVFIISLLPLGLGATYALIDRNSRGLADVVLRLRWLRQ